MAPHRDDSPPVPCAAAGQKASTASHLLFRSFKVAPHMVSSGSGIHLRLADGRSVIDACAGAAVAIIGHGNEEVHEALLEQARKVSYVHTQAYSTPVAEELANFLLDGRPHGLDMAFFVGSGSEAVESAMKLARQYHFERNESRRVHFVSRRQSYHGNSISALSVSSNVARKVPYQGFCYPHVSHVSPPYAYRYKTEAETEDDFTGRLLRELEDEFLRVGPETVIAFVAETVMGATSGCVTAPRGYFRGVRSLCDKYGILLILDEIMCGTGRTGTFFAFEQEEGAIEPDIVTGAKGLGGGYATIAAMYVHERVIRALRRGSDAFNHGHTYQAHPLSCAASLAVQKIVRRDDLIRRCRRMGERLEALLRTELAGCRSVGDIRGRGLFWAVEFVKDRTTRETMDPALSFGGKVYQAAFERGVAVYPGAGTVDGVRGDHVLLAPPFTVTEEELAVVCRVLREAVESQEKLYL
ncbi:aminotransferase [Drechmeria coniospora]|uniref:Aminotransferase n=1 Tax=Drechmeria coniospora TaxID=98403 RepID=A0A151GJM2_DRECN|nr:aminotransferase [Drechmeria coniospora]KYK57300.1 aminotransferase [Drechmeria coniospora]